MFYYFPKATQLVKIPTLANCCFKEEGFGGRGTPGNAWEQGHAETLTGCPVISW